MSIRLPEFLKNRVNSKNIAFWVILFYCIKGTAVTLGLIFAALVVI